MSGAEACWCRACLYREISEDCSGLWQLESTAMADCRLRAPACFQFPAWRLKVLEEYRRIQTENHLGWAVISPTHVVLHYREITVHASMKSVCQCWQRGCSQACSCRAVHSAALPFCCPALLSTFSRFGPRAFEGGSSWPLSSSGVPNPPPPVHIRKVQLMPAPTSRKHGLRQSNPEPHLVSKCATGPLPGPGWWPWHPS